MFNCPSNFKLAMSKNLSKHESKNSASTPREPLAVIGIGCRFPGRTNSAFEFWQNLIARVDGIVPVPPERWDYQTLYDPDLRKSGKIRNMKGGFLSGVDEFDADFFGYYPAEAVRIDPQQRLLLEVTHEAMEDAGLRYENLNGSRTAVFVGSFMYDYLCMQTDSAHRSQINPYVAMGCGLTAISNRISYEYNLTGPSVTLDTACSSSLVAIHLACRSLWSGEADLAIAGGVNLILRPEGSIMMSRAGFLNPDGHCKTFDAAANGYVRGEGVGIVILKPLSAARQDGDPIYALVRGSAVNQDGHVPEGFTVPNPHSQMVMLEAAYRDAGVEPTAVTYVEAHGTGTPVGDPIETKAIGTVLGQGRLPGQELYIGSVKTNVGHLEGASGVAGFIKAVLVLKNRMIPPNLHFHQPNPKIDFEGLRLRVPVDSVPLSSNNGPLRVGVNSFGAGGTNAHIVLEEFPYQQKSRANGQSDEDANSPSVFLLSTRNQPALQEAIKTWQGFLSTCDASLPDICYTLAVRRSIYPHGLVVVAASKQQVIQKLQDYAEGKQVLGVAKVAQKEAGTPRIGFLYSGQGGQWATMGRTLWQKEPVFRDTLDEVDRLFAQLAGWSLREEMFREEVETRINTTVVVQASIMATQVALTELWKSYGIQPAGVLGHSIGEVAAAWAAGALSLAEAVEVIYHRSHIQQRQAGRGGMLAVGLSLAEGQEMLRGLEDRVSIAAVNGPAMLALAGETEALAQIAQNLEQRGIFQRRINVEVAYHSHLMEPLQDDLLQSLGHVRGKLANLPLYSTVTACQEDGTHLGGNYWYHNVRQPVLFVDAVAQMLKDGFDTLIEIGPHPVLIAGVKDLCQKTGCAATILPSMRRRESEFVCFLEALGQLHLQGAQVNWSRRFDEPSQWIALPKHPWLHNRYWFEMPEARQHRLGLELRHPFIKRKVAFAADENLVALEMEVDASIMPWLSDHQVNEAMVVPAAGHLEMAAAAAQSCYPLVEFFLEDIRFESALILPESGKLPLQTRLEILSAEGDYAIASRTQEQNGTTAWRSHSQGRINCFQDSFLSFAPDFADIKHRFTGASELAVDAFYQTLRNAGLSYGQSFQGIRRLWHQGNEVLAELLLPRELEHEASNFLFHPALLDACFHAVFADVHRQGSPERIYLPHSIRRLKVFEAPSTPVWSYLRITRNDEESLDTDVWLFTPDGHLVAEIQGLVNRRLRSGGASAEAGDVCRQYEFHWRKAPLDEAGELPPEDMSRCIVLADRHGCADSLIGQLKDRGIEVSVLKPDKDWWEQLAGQPLDRRTHLVCLCTLRDNFDTIKLETQLEQITEFLLTLGQGLATSQLQPRVYLVTSGAWAVEASAYTVDLVQAVLTGFARTLHNECPNVPLKLIDLEAGGLPETLSVVYQEMRCWRWDLDEFEIAWRGGQRFLRELRTLSVEDAQSQATVELAASGSWYRADVTERGIVDNLTFRSCFPCVPKQGEVEIEVEAAGLNFKDIMNTMGLLSLRSVQGGLAGNQLGLEVSGRIASVGPDTNCWQIGDEVIARVAHGFAGRTIASVMGVEHKPTALTFAQAAAIPVVYVTAYYSLLYLGRISVGDRVLIHSAAGGVGLAALHLARYWGAEIFATTGTNAKRDYLQSLGVKHVFDSRALSFYDEIMAATNGQGVDIVLNSLSGQALYQSLKCLAPFGRFLELGKTDIYKNAHLPLERLGENISYHVVDVDRLAAQKPELHLLMLQEVTTLLAEGKLPPPEVTELPISRLTDAMKLMTRSQHKGKIVLTMAGDTVRALPPREIRFRQDRAYLITGGTSGFGLELARWLVAKGAGALVLVSRSGFKSKEDELIVEAIRAQGVQVRVEKLDVTDKTALDRLLDTLQTDFPLLAGVIHSAAVLDDSSLANMTAERFNRVFRPKALGAWNLHLSTVERGLTLDFFLMLSSMSAVLGLYGQSNYAAANYFLDSLAHERRLCNLKATSVNLGLLGDYAGMSRNANDTKGIINLLSSHGLKVMGLKEVLTHIELALTQETPQRIAVNIDWSLFQKAYPHLAKDSRLAALFTSVAFHRSSQIRSSLRDTLLSLAKPEQTVLLTDKLAEALGKILDTGDRPVPSDTVLGQLSLDSLMLTQLQNWILRHLDANYPIMKLLKGPSLNELAGDLCTQLCSSVSQPSNGVFNYATIEEAAFAQDSGWEILHPWLIRSRNTQTAPVRLFCFHSMGVGASLFTHFLQHPPENIEVFAIQQPGRENRSRELVSGSFDQVLEELVPVLRLWLDKPFFFWGHSFGGIIAYEAIRRLRQENGLKPFHFLVSGTIPPHLVRLWQRRDAINRPMLAENSAEYLISLSRYVEDPDFIKRILPSMRADYPQLMTYKYVPDELLDCNLTAFSALQDDMVYPDEIAQWKTFTHQHFDFVKLNGDHWFLNRHRHLFSDKLSDIAHNLVQFS